MRVAWGEVTPWGEVATTRQGNLLHPAPVATTRKGNLFRLTPVRTDREGNEHRPGVVATTRRRRGERYAGVGTFSSRSVSASVPLARDSGSRSCATWA